MIKGVLMDLSGTIHVGTTPITGAIGAVERLEKAGIAVRFVTNTSRKTRDSLHDTLAKMGFDIPREHMFTAPLAVRRYLEQHKLRPYLLVHPNLYSEFDGVEQENPNAVVVGDAEDDFSFRKMNEAFRLLKEGATLLATGRTRYFEGDQGLELDAGPYVAALEYAADTSAIVLGKPAPVFFHEAAEELGLQPSECVMVGDDAETDVAAALDAGLQAILVQTGKYREGDEARIGKPFIKATDIVAAVEEIMRTVAVRP
ncbi:TIGR01458 family HAD-type hydrolase [Geomonas sp.]|uniref:TIGR01458 family HAD-type hydrolase n=1 Tax=Geomonas sp. TaxID=2651584 RepID=UPI002B4A9C11|nr:TIGR01458 family HAD-type hydrolase [Geomonas sp.]HJV35182.1 TIGR01458 family HAD-type hydrolase [Geomonas sp.]